MGEREILGSLGDLGSSCSGPVLLRTTGLLLSVLVLLGGEWLYSGVLWLISTLALAEWFATLLPLVIGEVLVGWLYRLGGCRLRALCCILFAVVRVLF